MAEKKLSIVKYRIREGISSTLFPTLPIPNPNFKIFLVGVGETRAEAMQALLTNAKDEGWNIDFLKSEIKIPEISSRTNAIRCWIVAELNTNK